MVDSDTEFVTITDDTAALMENTYKDNKVTLITDNLSETIVHVNVLESKPSSYDILSCSNVLDNLKFLHNIWPSAFLAAASENSSQKAIYWYEPAIKYCFGCFRRCIFKGRSYYFAKKY